MSDEARNVEMLKQAYGRWGETNGHSADDWMKICADDIAFGSIAEGRSQAAQYLTSYSNRDALKEYFAGLTRDWEMVESTVDHYVAQGDRVVALGHCSWRFKKTGKVVSTPKCDSWRIENGKVVEFFEYYDTAQVMAAAT